MEVWAPNGGLSPGWRRNAPRWKSGPGWTSGSLIEVWAPDGGLGSGMGVWAPAEANFILQAFIESQNNIAYIAQNCANEIRCIIPSNDLLH